MGDIYMAFYESSSGVSNLLGGLFNSQSYVPDYLWQLQGQQGTQFPAYPSTFYGSLSALSNILRPLHREDRTIAERFRSAVEDFKDAIEREIII